MSVKNRIIFGIIIFFTVAVLFFSYYFINKMNTQKEFSLSIADADAYIESDEIMNAEESLLKSMSYNIKAREYKIILKRILKINSITMLKQVSEAAVTEYPEDRVFTSLYLYSLLKSNEFTKAGIYAESLEPENIVNSIYLEAIIRSGSKSTSESPFYQGVSNKKTEIFRELFRITGNSIFRVNESLLYLTQGNFILADDALKNIKLNLPQLNQLKFLIKYDKGDYINASKLLNLFDNNFSSKNMILLETDIYLRSGQFEKAREQYLEFLRLYPDFTWIAYYNYLWLELNRDNWGIDDLLNESLEHFPDNRFLVMLAVNFNKKNGEISKSFKYLEDYLSKNPRDPEMEIVLKELKGINSSVLINSVRTIINDNPENYQAASYLAWNLIENEQFSYLEKFLKGFTNNKTSEWIAFFNALILVKKGKEKSAIEEFQKAYLIKSRWETLYNIAVVSEYLFDFSTAVDYYQKSENSLSDSKRNMVIKSGIRTQLASLLFDLHEYQNAYREVKNALDQDENNLKALLLLNKLKTLAY